MNRTAALAPLFLMMTACSSDGKSTAPYTTYSRETLLDPVTCKECHADYFKEWSGSMHAYASKDPLFRAMNQRGQEETKGELKNFCVNCHAPMAVVEMGDDQAIDPAKLSPELEGVTCYFCHNVKEVGDSHVNNPLVLANDTTMRGGLRSATRYKAHDVAYSPMHDGKKLQSAALCGSCHDISVPAHLSGATEDQKLERTFQEWSTSTFGTGQGALTCNQCHVPTDQTSVTTIAEVPADAGIKLQTINRHLHDFVAVDTAFSEPDFPRANEQRAMIQDLLDKEFRIMICAPSPNRAGGPDPRISVQVENLNAGHNFPSGASQDRRVWIELHATQGTKSYDSGAVALGDSVVAARDTAIAAGGFLELYRDVTTKKDGSPAHMFWDVTNIENHTIPAPGPPPSTTQNFLTTVYRQRTTGLQSADKITVTLWVEPVGLDVIDDLTASGHLDASDGPRIRSMMPRYSVSPLRLVNPDAGTMPVSFEWTKEAAELKDVVGDDGGSYCLETHSSANSPR